MFERHGDVLNDGSVEALALDAIHGDKRAQVLSMELSALDALAGNGGGKRAKIAQIKELARLTLAWSRVSDAISSHRYVVAAKRAGDASYRALIKGDIATAADQKAPSAYEPCVLRRKPQSGGNGRILIQSKGCAP